MISGGTWKELIKRSTRQWPPERRSCSYKVRARAKKMPDLTVSWVFHDNLCKRQFVSELMNRRKPLLFFTEFTIRPAMHYREYDIHLTSDTWGSYGHGGTQPLQNEQKHKGDLCSREISRSRRCFRPRSLYVQRSALWTTQPQNHPVNLLSRPSRRRYKKRGYRCLQLLLTVIVTRIYGQSCEMIATGNVATSGLARTTTLQFYNYWLLRYLG